MDNTQRLSDLRKTIGVIIYNNPDHYPPTISAVHLLSKHFNIILIGRNHEAIAHKYPDNVKVYRIGHYAESREEKAQQSIFAKALEYINFVWQSQRILKKVDCVYAYDSFAFVSVCLKMFNQSPQKYIYYHCHEIPNSSASLTTLTGWIQFLEKKYLHQACEIIHPEKIRASYHQKFMKSDKEPIIIPNFPLLSFFNFNINWYQLFEERWKKLILFYRGAISESVSTLEILQSFNYLPLDYQKKIKIHFIGKLSKQYQKILSALTSSLQLENNFFYLGFYPYYPQSINITLTASLGFCLYKSNNLSTFASVTASNKIYEYAACGLPVIVSNTNNYYDYLKNETWVKFADPDNPQSIAEAIVSILSNTDTYQQMCFSARHAFENKFNYNQVFEPILDKIKQKIATC